MHNYQHISFLTKGICPQSVIADNSCNITGGMCSSNAECPSSRLCCEDRCGRYCKLPGISFIHSVCDNSQMLFVIYQNLVLYIFVY